MKTTLVFPPAPENYADMPVFRGQTVTCGAGSEFVLIPQVGDFFTTPDGSRQLQIARRTFQYDAAKDHQTVEFTFT